MPTRPWWQSQKPAPDQTIVNYAHALMPTVAFVFNYPVKPIGAGTILRAYARHSRKSPRSVYATYDSAEAISLVRSSFGYALRLMNTPGLAAAWKNGDTGADLPWGDIMTASRKSVVCGLTIVSTGESNSATYALSSIIEDSGSYMGIMFGNKTSGSDTGEKIYAYNWDGGDKGIGLTYTIGVPVVFGYTHDGTTMRVYKDGRFFTSLASGATSNTGGTLRFGTSQSNGVAHQHFLYAYDCVLSASQIAEVSRNPFGPFLEKTPTRFFVPVAPVTGKPWTYQRMMAS